MSDVLPRLSVALADRYRIERELGAGGMATVYLAHDLKHDRDVAIKVLHPHLGAALGGERFLSEIKTTARLQHPHILPLLDSGDAGDGLLYYVMPFVAGETLRARLEREKQLPIEDATLFAREIGDALQHAHAQGIVHRDIKPENILLQGGHALVADFGIALAVQQAAGERLTQTGISLGTPQYMSPEQAMGERSLDARSDIYALGTVTYEMLTGDAPFTGSSAQAIVAKVMTERPTAPSTVRDTIPAGVERVVLKALAKLPADRHASAAEFVRALQTTVSPETVAANVASSTRASRLRAVASGLAIGALLGAGAGALALWPRTRAASRQAAIPTRQQITFSGLARRPAISDDGSVIAYVERRCTPPGYAEAGEDGTGSHCRSSLIVQDTGGSAPVRIIDNVPEISNVRWASNGTALVVEAKLDSLREGLFVVPRLGGTVRSLGAGGAMDVDWSSDTIVVLRTSNAPERTSFAVMIPIAGGVPTDSVRLPAYRFDAVAWSPNGRLLALKSPTKVWLVGRDGIVSDTTTAYPRARLRWSTDGRGLLVFAPRQREDDLVRWPISGDGKFDGEPQALVPGLLVLYRGEFDVARRAGTMVIVTGEPRNDLWSFSTSDASNAAPVQMTSGTTWYSAPTLSSDGRTLYALRNDALGDNLHRFKIGNDNQNGEALTSYRALSENEIHPALSSDDRSVIFVVSEGHREWSVGVDAATLRSTRAPIDVGALGGGVLAPSLSGKRSVLWSWDTGRLLLLSGTDAPRALPIADSVLINSVSLSPDGNQLAAAVVSGDVVRLIAATLDPWQPRTLAEFPKTLADRQQFGFDISPIVWRADGSLLVARWESVRQELVLYRLDPRGGSTPARVRALPPRCAARDVAIAAKAPVAACRSSDFRSDLYLFSAPAAP